ncbi:MAG: signal peptidase II [Holosporales bacterium]|nr:signal peptidase II [Holosporales bacterium]
MTRRPMRNVSKINSYCLLLCVFVVIFDQAAKFSVLAFLTPNSVINVFTGFNIVLVFNKGTSFGLFMPGIGMIITLTIICLAFLIYMFFKLNNFSERILCSLVIGGAIGNLLDRFLHGAVVDFIDVYYKDWHWPAFNVADSFISVSIVCLVIFNLFLVKK